MCELLITERKMISRYSWVPKELEHKENLKILLLVLMKRHRLLGQPIRSLGVRGADLIRADSEQLSFSPDIVAIQRAETLEGVVDGLRKRYGNCTAGPTIRTCTGSYRR